MTRETLPHQLSTRKTQFSLGLPPVLSVLSLNPPFVSLSLSLLFSLFSNWDDKISDCHSYSCLLLIDKTISNPSWAPYASDALLSQSQSLSTETGSISLFELSTTASAFISELLGKEMGSEWDGGLVFSSSTHWGSHHTRGDDVSLFYAVWFHLQPRLCCWL